MVQLIAMIVTFNRFLNSIMIKQHRTYLEHRSKLLTQFAGMVAFVILNIATNVFDVAA